MKVELHITEATVTVPHFVSDVVTGTDWQTLTPRDVVTTPSNEGSAGVESDPSTVVQLATDHDMSAYDIAALLRSVANSLSPRNPQENP